MALVLQVNMYRFFTKVLGGKQTWCQAETPPHLKEHVKLSNQTKV